jgi:hypothetical protein
MTSKDGRFMISGRESHYILKDNTKGAEDAEKIFTRQTDAKAYADDLGLNTPVPNV